MVKILAVGGGSGGHVTPVAAVLSELDALESTADLRFWCDRVFEAQARSIMQTSVSSVRVDVVMSGKLRRYTHLSLLQHLLIPSILFGNLRDGVKVLLGFFQAFIKLIMWRPDVVFVKGGYVCLPVGWAAHVLRIPIVTHDSDAHPGLTNRLLSRYATMIATGAPLKYYSYPAAKSRYVGVPINPSFQPLSKADRRAEKRRLGFDERQPLIVVTGGGLGAQRINEAVIANADTLAELGSVYLVTGKAQYEDLRTQIDDTDSFKMVAFVSEGMNTLVGAADVVVTRAGATSILELAATHAATILVPNARLTGGHQTKNAAVYSDAGAALVVDETKFQDTPNELIAPVREIIQNSELRKKLSRSIAQFATPHAALDMARIIYAVAKRQDWHSAIDDEPTLS